MKTYYAIPLLVKRRCVRGRIVVGDRRYAVLGRRVGVTLIKVVEPSLGSSASHAHSVGSRAPCQGTFTATRGVTRGPHAMERLTMQ